MRYRWLFLGLLLTGLIGCSERPEDTDDQEPVPGPVADVVDRQPVSLRVATWNVRRFFDTVCDSGRCGGDNFEALPTEEEFEARADEIAEAIRALDADIMLLQEIESEACMEALRTRLGDVYGSVVIGETRLAGSVDTAVLARGRRLETRTHRRETFQGPDGRQESFVREFLEVHFEIDGRQVVVFSAHFKSKSNDNPSRRLAEAARAREIVISTAGEKPDALVVLGGDLNDAPGSEPLDALEVGGDLNRVAADLDPDSWTHVFRGNIVAIDHLYHANRAAGAYVSGSAKVMREGTSYGGSDHGALYADFLID